MPRAEQTHTLFLLAPGGGARLCGEEGQFRCNHGQQCRQTRLIKTAPEDKGWYFGYGLAVSKRGLRDWRISKGFSRLTIEPSACSPPHVPHEGAAENRPSYLVTTLVGCFLTSLISLVSAVSLDTALIALCRLRWVSFG